MADFTITAAQVTRTTGATATGTAGATITAGQVLYVDTADANKLKLFDANGSADAQICVGISLHGASSGQPIEYITDGTLILTTGAALSSAGQVVIGSGTTPGAMAPRTDLAVGWRANVLGYLDSTGKILKVNISRADVVLGA